MTEIMGGNITVRSTPGVGSSFTVKLYLPGVSHHGEIRTETARIEGYRGRRITVLVADDDANHRELVDNILRPLGFIVFAIPDGASCLALADEFRPQLILLDVNMPNLSGWETASQLRANGHTDCKIIILSADATKANQPHQAEDAYDEFLPKPFDLSLLMERIGTLLQIEWVYASGINSSLSQEKMTIAAILEPATITELLQLSRIGYAKGFLRRMAQIEEKDTRTAAAVNSLRTMASELKFDEIARLLEASGGNATAVDNA
jgi:CheY-like chemotaxis protein